MSSKCIASVGETSLKGTENYSSPPVWTGEKWGKEKI